MVSSLENNKYKAKAFHWALHVGKKVCKAYRENQRISAKDLLAYEVEELMKKVEKELKDEFGPKLSDLTMNQGQLMMKLIDRETGNTSYEIVKELRGSFSAFFWQGIAKIFSSDMKKRYDADGDDRKIEDIISLIDKGLI